MVESFSTQWTTNLKRMQFVLADNVLKPILNKLNEKIIDQLHVVQCQCISKKKSNAIYRSRRIYIR